MPKNMAQHRHIVPLHWHANTDTGVATKFVQLKKFHRAQLIVSLGTTGTDSYTVQVQASAAAAGSTATDLAFNYRITAIAGTDTMGAVTASASTGLVMTHGAAGTGRLIIIDIDASDLPAGKPYVGIYLTRAGSATAQILVMAILEPRYPQETSDGAVT